MTSYIDDPDSEIRSLPQCGFGSDIDYNNLIKSNHFLFRVYTPKERSPFSDDTDPFFLAPRFDEQVARSPIDLPKIKFSEPSIGSYAEVARHMEWTTRTSSSYISTSFSFSWSIWEAVRRYHQGMKKDVEIAIIDASALGGRAATAVQLLQKSSPAERTEKYWKWHRFSQESQSVLVYGMVPRTAVLASVPLLQILRKMPSYFLRKDIQTIYGNPLDQVAWDFALRKHNYHQFCDDMSKVFLGRSPEVKLRDSTAGSVRLALSFLRPFFHRVVQEDFDIAISYLRTLAITISEWPGDKWVRDHGEIRKIIETMVLALGEELREKYFLQKQEEISRLQVVIHGLQQTIEIHNAGITRPIVEVVETHSDDDFDIGFEDSEEPTLVTMDLPPVLKERVPLQTTFAVLPGLPVVFRTPITPPESPRNSLFGAATTIIPLGEIVSTSYSPQRAAGVSQQDHELELHVVSKMSPASEEPASPPPTPPSESPIFLPRTLSPVIEDPISSHEEYIGQPDTQPSSQYVVEQTELFAEPILEQEEEEDHDQDHDQDSGISAKESRLEELQTERHEQMTPLEQESSHDIQEKVESHETSLNKGIPVDEDEDDGEKTDLEFMPDPEHQDPPSPLTPWVFVPRARPKVSSFSSTRSSIASLDTLCDPGVEFPLKRFSLARTDSIEFVPPHPSFRSFGIVSRTISFSEPSASPALNPTDIPLPPSPQISLGSFSSSHSTLSLPSSPSPLRSNSLGSLPPSPSASRHSNRSLSSSSSSSSGSLPSTPTPFAESLPTIPVGVIIPPKGRISLLSPLPEIQEIDDEDDRRSIQSIRVAETASYIVTGFLVGAFITLFLFSTQRRQLLMLT